jgi:hypothetical protein
MIDKIFKTGLLVLGICFLILYYISSQNNRYVWKEGEASISVFDTRTGIIYATSSESIGKDKWLVINPTGGRTELKEK